MKSVDISLENCSAVNRYFPRKLLHCKYASVGECLVGRDKEGGDRTERDGIGWKGTGLDGKGRDGIEREPVGDRKERDRTGWRGTRQDSVGGARERGMGWQLAWREKERGGEGRDRTERGWTG